MPDASAVRRARRAAAATPIDAFRRSLYGKIEIAKKELALDDDTYRDMLEAKFGKRSRTKLSNAQLVDLVEHFRSLGFTPKKKAPARAGKRPLAEHPTARKARALWISLYHLGCISEPSESALGAFVKRQAGVDDLRFLRDERPVVEALKSWAARDAEKGGGGVDWTAYRVWNGVASEPRYDPRARVLEAQWRILHDLGEVKIRDLGALNAWLDRFWRRSQSYVFAPAADQDRAIEALGAMVRKAKEKARAEAGS